MFSVDLRALQTARFLVLSTAMACGQPNAAAQTPVVLMEATIDCGWGQVYSVVPGRLDKQQTQWLTAVLGYINNGEVNRDGFTFEERAEIKTSGTTMKSLLENPDFTAWTGKSLAQALNGLILRRTVLLEQSPSFFNPKTMFKQPVFESYWAARERTLQRLEQVGVRRTDNEVDCD